MRTYRRRVIDDELDELVGGVAAVSLDGPKGVGKTATAEQRARTIHRLDDPRQLAVVTADPGRLTAGRPPVLIDEWQRFPPSWDLVRRAVDDDPTPGRFILTGSATPDSPDSHSGAGRIVRVRMRPLSLFERGVASPAVSLSTLLTGSRPRLNGHTEVRLADYAAAICASGFPALDALAPRVLRAQLDSYLAGVVDRDLPQLGYDVRNPNTLRRWMAAYAAVSSTSATYEKIRDAATPGQRDKPAKTTTTAYRDLLKRLWLVDPVPAWSPSRNHLRRLGAAPKHQLADPALAARLLGIDADALVSGEPSPVVRDGALVGQLFESLVTLDIRVYAQHAEAAVSHLRTGGGDQEVDLIVQRPDQRVIGVEVKLAAVPSDDDVRHLLWLRDRLGDDLLDMVVVTSGADAYRRADGVAVVPAALLGP